MRKIGILGGSFDPIHQGHLNIARSAYREFALDEVWFIPAGHSPNKEEAEMTPAQVRAEMTQAAIKNDASFKLSRIEIESSGTSYTYKTLQHLKEQFPEDQLSPTVPVHEGGDDPFLAQVHYGFGNVGALHGDGVLYA